MQPEAKQNMADRIEKPRRTLLSENVSWARKALGNAFGARAKAALDTLTREFAFSVKGGDLQILNRNWYVTHIGLIRLARRKRCRGIHVEAVDSLCDSAGFVGYGDADPSNVSQLVRGAEMRIAETRAVNRALPGLLSPSWFVFLAWCAQAIGVLPNLYQGVLEKELDLLIRRAVFPLREFFDLGFQACSYSDKYGNSGFVHLQITTN